MNFVEIKSFWTKRDAIRAYRVHFAIHTKNYLSTVSTVAAPLWPQMKLKQYVKEGTKTHLHQFARHQKKKRRLLTLPGVTRSPSILNTNIPESAGRPSNIGCCGAVLTILGRIFTTRPVFLSDMPFIGVHHKIELNSCGLFNLRL